MLLLIQLQLQDSARGTTATSHTAGDLIKIAPPFPRKNVFDAVCDQIKNLFPTLFAVETQSITTNRIYAYRKL